MCNIVRGFLGPELDVDTVGIVTNEGIVALPPLMNVENIVDHYWSVIVDGKGTIVINAGRDNQESYKHDGISWLKQANAKIKQTGGDDFLIAGG